tara:strand:+ start:2411 stop:3700 length:1290 start_codon:yes stop_codon:yes gene_type:complete
MSKKVEETIKEKVLEKVEEAKETVESTKEKPPQEEGSFKIKKVTKPKQLGDEKLVPDLVKVDLSKPKKEEKDAIQVGETKEVAVGEQTGDSTKVDESVLKSSKVSETQEEKIESDSPLQEITDEEDNTNETGMDRSTETTTASQKQEEIQQEGETQKLPENIENLVKFMEETGGTVEDYARLNADYSKVNDEALLHEYYKQAKPHLNMEERSFIIEDSFSYDEEVDEERDIKKKKLAYKEEIAKAKNFLEDLKSKYYAEIKLRPGVTQEQQKAMDFFNRYTEDQALNEAKHERFVSKTKTLFNEDFKGFDFKLGDKKFRYGVKDPSNVADNQSDISNFIQKFLNKNGEVENHQGYHKALYAAQNVDTIANHFYEQGKTDAIKEQLAKSKNISTEPRKTASGEVFVGGLKVKAISGLDSSKLRIKKKTFN